MRVVCQFGYSSLAKIDSKKIQATIKLSIKEFMGFSMSKYCTLLFVVSLCVGCFPTKKEEVVEPVTLPTVNWEEGNTSVENAATEGEYRVKFETTAGDFVLLVHRDWAPLGAERLHALVESKFYDGVAFHQVNPGMIQFGISGDPKATTYWDKPIVDEPVKESNYAALVSFAKKGENSRRTQLCLSLVQNSYMDGEGYSPLAEVESGWEVVKSINSEYGINASEEKIKQQGNEYIFKNFPNMDYIIQATIVANESDSDEEAGTQK